VRKNEYSGRFLSYFRDDLVDRLQADSKIQLASGTAGPTMTWKVDAVYVVSGLRQNLSRIFKNRCATAEPVNAKNSIASGTGPPDFNSVYPATCRFICRQSGQLRASHENGYSGIQQVQDKFTCGQLR
jgi:hypothetical protein